MATFPGLLPKNKRWFISNGGICRGSRFSLFLSLSVWGCGARALPEFLKYGEETRNGEETGPNRYLGQIYTRRQKFELEACMPGPPSNQFSPNRKAIMAAGRFDAGVSPDLPSALSDQAQRFLLESRTTKGCFPPDEHRTVPPSIPPPSSSSVDVRWPRVR